MVVMKFGGTSVADADAIARLAEIVTREPRAKVVVVSALAGVTDALIEVLELTARDSRRSNTRLQQIYERHIDLARAVTPARASRPLSIDLRRLFSELRALVRAAGVLGHASPACRDAALACGELASSRIVSAALRAWDVPAAWLDARKVIVTDERHTRAAPMMEETAARLERLVRPRLDLGDTVVLGGFAGATRHGATTTLGRGGSDYSAAVVGSCLRAEEIQIWTDVDGMFTADPRLVRSARLLSHVSFDDATALARFGAKVLHPATLAPARARNIPVRILNARRAADDRTAPGAHSGTLITGDASCRRLIAGVAAKKNISVTTIEPTPETSHELALARAFAILDRAGAGVDLVTISDAGASLAHDARGAGALAEGLARCARVRSRSGLALVCAVGEGLRHGLANSRELLAALDGIPVVMLSQGGEGRTITCVIPEHALGQALTRLHSTYVHDLAPGAPHGTRPSASDDWLSESAPLAESSPAG